MTPRPGTAAVLVLTFRGWRAAVVLAAALMFVAASQSTAAAGPGPARKATLAITPGRSGTVAGAAVAGAAWARVSSGKPAKINPNAPCPGASSAGGTAYSEQVADIEKDLASHIGIAFSGPAYIELNTQNLPTAGDPNAYSLMYTWGCRGTSVATSTVTSCAVHIQPHTLPPAYSAHDVDAFFYHELTHCLLLEHFGASYAHFPGWYLEGLPTWVEAVLGGGDPEAQGYWQDYLNSPSTSLFTRQNDGIGFFVHLAETGTDVWHKIIPIGQAFIDHADSSTAGWAAAAPTADFLQTWGPSFVTGRYPATGWDTGGKGLTHYDSKLLPPTNLLNGVVVTVSSGVAAASLRPLDVGAQVVQLVSPSANAQGMLSTGASDQADALATAAQNVYCTMSSCSCPAMSLHPGQHFVHMAAGLEYIGLTGGPNAASVLLRGETLESYCGLSCFAGKWVVQDESGSFASGGAGITWTMTPSDTGDGTVLVDYNGSAPIILAGIAYKFTGEAFYKITNLHVMSPTAGDYVATPVSSDVQAEYKVAGQTHTETITEVAHTTDYMCSGSSILELATSGIDYHLERVGPPPSTTTAGWRRSGGAGGQAPVQASARQARTASARAGQSSLAHGPNGVAPRPASATSASGSTHSKEPAWPKWPKVVGEFLFPVQWGDFVPRISGPRPQSQLS